MGLLNNNLVNNTAAQDPTTSYFNNFYVSPFSVSQGVDDAFISFFEKITANKDTARALAGSVIYTAKAQGLDPMSVMQQFSSLPLGQLNAYLVLFLNTNRISTSFLGISNLPKINFYVKRTILP
jgi:hypothetical protein